MAGIGELRDENQAAPEVVEEPQGRTFRNQATGDSITLPPGLTSEQERQMLERFRDQMLARRSQSREFRVGSMETQLGAPLARQPGTEDRLAEFDRPGTRFDVSKSVSPEGKMAKLQAKFPDMEIEMVDDPKGGQLIALRLPGEDQFTLLDSDEATTISDVADIGGDLVSLETLATIITTFRTGGLNVFLRAGAQAVGAVTGRAGDIALESARGFEKRTLEEIGDDLKISAAFAGVGEFLFFPIQRGVQAGLRRGGRELTPEQQAAQAAAESPEEGLFLGDVGTLMERQQRQAQATSTSTQRRVQDRLAAGLQTMRNFRERLMETGGFGGLNTTDLDRVIVAYEDELLRMINPGPIDPALGGRALIAGRKEYVQAAKAHIGRKYDAAIAKSEGVSFDISKAKQLADDFRRGVEMINDEGDLVRVSIDPEGELGRLINTLAELDPNVNAFDNVSAFEQVKTLRTQFFDHKNAVIPGQERMDNRMAGQIWDALTEAMDNPAGEGSEEFQRLYRAASLANKRKESILEAADMRIIAQTSPIDAEGLVRRVAQPYNGSILRVMSRTMPAEQFETFRKAFMSDLTSEPEKIIGRLDAFRRDPRALRILLTPDEQTNLRAFGNDMKILNAQPFKEALTEISDLQARSIKIARESDVEALQKFIAQSGGKLSPQGHAIRAGMVTDLINRHTEIVKNREILDADGMVKDLLDLEQSGKLQAIFPADEVDFLLGKRGLFSFFKAAEDPGALIRAGAVASNVAEGVLAVPTGGLVGGLSFLKGLRELGRNSVIGWITTSPRARTAALGMGKRPVDLTTLRAMTVISSEMVADITEQKEKVLDKRRKKGGK